MEKISKETIKKGKTLFKTGKVKKELETNQRIHFTVQGKTDIHYVIFEKEKKEWKCDCPYFSLHEKKCSHILAANLKKS